MFKTYFMLLLLGHVLGDYYIQTNNVARKKEDSLRWLFVHCICYWFTILILCAPIMSWEIFSVGTGAAILHTLVDVLKFVYIRSIRKQDKMTLIIDRNVYFADQLLHLLCIVVISYIAEVYIAGLYENPLIIHFFDTLGISGYKILTWLVAILLIHRPANITISKLLAIFRPESSPGDKDKSNSAGKLIGTIERIIILILISIGEYSAIGLVLTAKSIARYDKISKVKDFAEYYLLGTLISTMIVIIVSLIF